MTVISFCSGAHSNATNAVKILVVLAISMERSASFSYSTSPVSASSKMAAVAEVPTALA